MEQIESRELRYAGTPPTHRRIGYKLPDGTTIAAMVKMPSDYVVSVFADPTTNCTICVGTSPDKRQLIAERWLSYHAQRRLERSADARMTHAQLVAALLPELTAGDQPRPIPAIPLQLEPLRPSEYSFSDEVRSRRGKKAAAGPADSIVVTCEARGFCLRMEASGNRQALRGAFRCVGQAELCFLFQVGNDYVLDAIRMHGLRQQQRQARATKRAVGNRTPQQIIELLHSQLTEKS